jgi:hypothetical protein
VEAGNPTMYTDSYITHRQSSLRVRYHQFNNKSRQAEETPASTPIADFKDYTMLRMQFANAISSQTADEDRRFESQSQRSRGRHLTPPDEFDIYIREPVIDRQLYNGDPNLWWKEIGQSRFLRLSYMASNLLSIPSFIAYIKRQFNSIEMMLTLVRNCLRPIIVN